MLSNRIGHTVGKLAKARLTPRGQRSHLSPSFVSHRCSMHMPTTRAQSSAASSRHSVDTNAVELDDLGTSVSVGQSPSTTEVDDVAKASLLADQEAPDGGYGWVVVAGCGTICFWFVGSSYNWGILSARLVADGTSDQSRFSHIQLTHPTHRPGITFYPVFRRQSHRHLHRRPSAPRSASHPSPRRSQHCSSRNQFTRRGTNRQLIRYQQHWSSLLHQRSNRRRGNELVLHGRLRHARSIL